MASDYQTRLLSALPPLVAGEHPLLTAVEMTPDGPLTASAPGGWAIVAKHLSKSLSGQVWPSQTGITWICGKHREWILSPRGYENALEARQVAALLGIPAGWTVGSVARSCLDWTGIKQGFSGAMEKLVEETGWHYYLCKPGSYKHAMLADMRGAYFQLLSRLPTPIVHADSRRVWFGAVDPDQDSRWKVLLPLVADNKPLRNSLVGVAAGGREPRTVYIRGEARQLRGGFGPLRAAALLVVRTCWELCALAAREVDAIYANTDSVMARTDVEFKTWGRYGINWRKDAYGPAELCAVGVYRVGPKRTMFYEQGSRLWIPTPEPPDPTRWVAETWL